MPTPPPPPTVTETLKSEKHSTECVMTFLRHVQCFGKKDNMY